ncbi:uncharacterized protein LOC108154240 isoform X1 [Drosophila miranda]|uniref:uncharacterized protein LOC108154240 isoform X1 n=2 Tax=Drosophila miranda TaxID=7229 RepID=UPI0007E7FE5B|nr:uncharacterized protein LOC108154240 isoform X1 [Drosophila miranda]
MQTLGEHEHQPKTTTVSIPFGFGFVLLAALFYCVFGFLRRPLRRWRRRMQRMSRGNNSGRRRHMHAHVYRRARTHTRHVQRIGIEFEQLPKLILRLFTQKSVMNHLRVHKFKIGGKDSSAVSAAVAVAADPSDNNNGNHTNNNNNQNGNGGGGAKGFLTRIKRYSVLGNKLSRRHLGSLNLQSSAAGAERGADGERLGSGQSPGKTISGSYNMTGSHSEDHRLEIGAPVLISTTTLDTDRFDVTEARLKQIGGGIAQTSTIVRTLTPRSSDEEEFLDARCTQLDRDERDEAEEFQTPIHQPQEEEHEEPQPQKEEPAPQKEVESQPQRHSQEDLQEDLLEEEEEKMVMPPMRRANIARQQQAMSVQNLHRTELKVYLHKSPSMTLDMNVTAPGHLGPGLNMPELPELYGDSKLSLAASDRDNNKENTPVDGMPIANGGGGFLSQQSRFKSIESFQLHSRSKRSSSQPSSKQSSKMSLDCSVHSFDFDFKSVSYQSLNAQNLMVSIDELQEITRQINETEDFTKEVDLEYCEHRDQLRPSERRITLLKNKNQTLIHFNQQKEKLRKGWHGMKHWLGEEGTRLKEAVRQQTPLKRLARSRSNLNQSTTDASRLSISPERNTRDTTESCEDITNRTELDSSMSQRALSDEDLSPNAKRFKDEGQNGFEELRRYIKQGGDFSKELIFVLQERADSELIYSKSLSKLANKLNKAGREIPGSVADAWRGVATEMESRSDIHRQLAASLTDELVKPLKVVVESHHKARKAVESTVDKAARVLSEWRITEAKAKKASHTAARENEKLQDAMLDVRIQKSPSIAMLHQGPNKISAEKELKNAEKDCVKLDNKRKKAEEAVKRADVEYYTMCVRAERARVDWEMAVLRGSSQLQTNEQQRLANMHNFAQQYGRLISDINPILGGLTCRLQPQLDACNVDKDMLVVSNIRHHSEGPSEQLLPDFYCEHTTLAMNRERRKHALIKLLQLVKTDLERERKSRDGLRGLSQSLNNQENQNITDKLYHIRSMLTYLEGSRIKLQSALLELDHKPRTTHPLAQHIQITRDRTGLQQSILKVPNWLKNKDKTQQSTGLDVSGGHQEDEPEEEDACSQMMGNALSNSSCADISVTTTGPALKHFNRSKSNIETFTTSQPKIISTTNASLAAVALAAASVKCKTIPANHQHSHHHNHHQGSDRGQADGGSNQQDSDFDEFSSQDEDEEDTGPVKGQQVPQSQLQSQNQMPTQHFYQNAQDLQKGGGHGHGQGQGQVLGRCKALYSYTPKLYDELELSPGDIIEVHAKQDDGWWLGALRNHIGIFPATYVEEC